MIILTLETATDACSAAILRDGQVLTVQGEPLHRIQRENAEHAKMLPLMVDELLALLKNADGNGQIDAVAVSAGPGSYTGLRIGASVAKGLAYGLNVPLYAVPTLRTMAAQVAATCLPQPDQRPLLCPMIDARRMEVYAALYDTHLQELHPAEAVIVDEHSFADVLADRKVCFFGNGAGKCQAVLPQANALFVNDIVPDAAYMDITGCEPVDTAYWTPFYLKDYEAKKSVNKVLVTNQ